VHAIDRDTSGLVLFARSAEARDPLKDQFEQRTPVRVYQAVVEGIVRPPRGRWADQLAWDAAQLRQRKAHATDARGKESRGEYVVIEQFAAAALVQVSLVTGKRNQTQSAGRAARPSARRRAPVPVRRAGASGRAAPRRPPGAPRVAPRVSAIPRPAGTSP